MSSVAGHGGRGRPLPPLSPPPETLGPGRLPPTLLPGVHLPQESRPHGLRLQYGDYRSQGRRTPNDTVLNSTGSTYSMYIRANFSGTKCFAVVYNLRKTFYRNLQICSVPCSIILSPTLCPMLMNSSRKRI